MPAQLLQSTARGLFCAAGDFHVDPWAPVPLALVTHAHADHVVEGCDLYRCAQPSVALLARRFPKARVQGTPYGEAFPLGETTVSFHPAGHILGSAQLRVEHQGQVWVVSGDYKRQPDPTCAAFERLPCDVLVTEATFGLPVYRWDPGDQIVEAIHRWWQQEQAEGRNAVLLCYALGKAQRILSGLLAYTPGPVYVHGAIAEWVEVYRAEGIALPAVEKVVDLPRGRKLKGELVLAPLSARGTPWMRRLGDSSVGLASGWMRVRGERRRRHLDRGFALSDHADFDGLVRTVEESGAKRVLVTHGTTEPFARYLRERGYDAATLATRYELERAD